jgi:hypothetical protein
MSEVQKDSENVSAGIGQKIIYKVLNKFSCNLRSKLARSTLTSPGPIRVKKAFDSTSHKYLQLVYNFFNFGPNFIQWLNLLGTNRRACIILDNEINSAFFDLQLGNAQGDTVLFRRIYLILAFKYCYLKLIMICRYMA